jgi:hypothetical protein
LPKIQNRWREIDMADRLRDTNLILLPRYAQDIRNRRRLVEHEPFSQKSMRAHHVAVIARENGDGAIAQAERI